MTDRKVHPIFEPLLDSVARWRELAATPASRRLPDHELAAVRALEWLERALAGGGDRAIAEAVFGFRRAARAAFRERPDLAPPGSHATAGGRRKPREATKGGPPRRRRTDPPQPPEGRGYRITAAQHFVGEAYHARVTEADTGERVVGCLHRHRTTKAARACGLRLLKRAKPGGPLRVV